MIEAELRVLARLLGIKEVDATWSKVYVAVLDMSKVVNGLFNELDQVHSRIAELEAKLATDEASS